QDGIGGPYQLTTMDTAPEETELVLAEESSAQAVAEELLLDAADDGHLEFESEVRSLHQFPKGARAGIFLHGLLEWATEQGINQVWSDLSAHQDRVQRRLCARGLEDRSEPMLDWLLGFLDRPLPLTDGTSLALGQLDEERGIAELEFWFAVTQADS